MTIALQYKIMSENIMMPKFSPELFKTSILNFAYIHSKGYLSIRHYLRSCLLIFFAFL